MESRLYPRSPAAALSNAQKKLSRRPRAKPQAAPHADAPSTVAEYIQLAAVACQLSDTEDQRVTGTLGDEVLALDTADEKLLWELDVQVLRHTRRIRLLEEANRLAWEQRELLVSGGGKRGAKMKSRKALSVEEQAAVHKATSPAKKDTTAARGDSSSFNPSLQSLNDVTPAQLKKAAIAGNKISVNGRYWMEDEHQRFLEGPPPPRTRPTNPNSPNTLFHRRGPDVWV